MLCCVVYLLLHRVVRPVCISKDVTLCAQPLGDADVAGLELASWSLVLKSTCNSDRASLKLHRPCILLKCGKLSFSAKPARGGARLAADTKLRRHNKSVRYPPKFLFSPPKLLFFSSKFPLNATQISRNFHQKIFHPNF